MASTQPQHCGLRARESSRRDVRQTRAGHRLPPPLGPVGTFGGGALLVFRFYTSLFEPNGRRARKAGLGCSGDGQFRVSWDVS